LAPNSDKGIAINISINEQDCVQTEHDIFDLKSCRVRTDGICGIGSLCQKYTCVHSLWVLANLYIFGKFRVSGSAYFDFRVMVWS